MLTRIPLALALLTGASAALGAPRSPSRLVGNEETTAWLGKRIFRARQDAGERASAIHSLGLALWTVACPAQDREAMAGTSKADLTLVDNMLASTEAALTRRGFAVKRLPRPDGGPSAEAWREVALLDEAVGRAILDATWNGWFRAKVASFEYRLGDLTTLLSEQGVDAVLFVGAACDEASAGYWELYDPSHPVVVIHFSFADRGGEVLWFELFASRDRYELRDRRVTDKLLRHVFQEFPGVK
jgi:hypothetical protein